MNNNVIFYDHPKQGFNGDFIPFFHEGVFHLYMIIDGSWEHLTTTDFINFTNHGVALPKGNEEEQDLSVCTGSVFYHNNLFHIFYAGYNGFYLGKKPIQVVLHATSTDLYNWKKEKDVFLPPDESIYHRDGWRDPYVYYDKSSDEYKMIITGEKNHHHNRRWGATALAISKDLINWTIKEPIYAPFLYDTHECPDLFELNGRYYMIFSTYTRRWEVHYRVSHSIDGPWKSYKDELLDNRSYYAAKTVYGNGKRYLVGWAARRTDNLDKNKYEWGGSLCVHEIEALPNGELICKPVSTIVDAYTKILETRKQNGFGNIVSRKTKNGYSLDSDGFGCIKIAKTKSSSLYISFDVKIKDNMTAGILLRANINKFDKWVMIELDRKKDRLFFDLSSKWFEDQFFDEERPLDKSSNYHVEIITKDSMIVTYCNGKALSARCYELMDGEIGLFSRDGKAVFNNITIKEL